MTNQRFHTATSSSFMSNRDNFAVLESLALIVGEDGYQINTDADAEKIIVDVANESINNSALCIHDAPNGNKITHEQIVKIIQDHIDGGYAVVYSEMLDDEGKVTHAHMDMVGGSFPGHFGEVISYRMTGMTGPQVENVIRVNEVDDPDMIAFIADTFGVKTGEHGKTHERRIKRAA